MKTLALLRNLNTRGVPVALLMLLVGISALCHRAAISHFTLDGWPSPVSDTRVQAQARLIGYVDTHPSVVLLSLSLFAVCLVWHQVRRLPRWSLWFTLVIFAAPVLAYSWLAISLAVTPVFGQPY